ncbi:MULTISPECIES: LysR family transcriptional regulator [Streptomyces]|uniref:LysR family transcriptional regulator n=1 Tax=Streptomyces TaxID=1883 RepID=UPI0019625225|nr:MULTISPECIES: LysR family transcriptional regulator [Streptomyces]QRX94863.1 LysR family transcriptional regulator [Streptomyces noursei]UJB44570.1 LysR family transcriptional regulator [Streptomyces sp. A1-5]
MSLRQMEYLVAVVEEQSFTRAAEALHVSQSALSHQIKALEREVGGPLLERMNRGVRLTAMGRAYYPHAELAVRSARQARRAALAAGGAESGELHIATVHAQAIGVLPAVCARWTRLHPGVRLVLHEYATTDELTDQMVRGVADVALGPRPEDWPGPVTVVGRERMVVVVPHDDPLAARESLRLTDLADRPWVRCSLEPVLAGRRWLDVECERAGFTPRTAVRTQHTSTAVRMASAGVGVLLTAAHELTGLDCARIPTDPPWRRDITVFSRVELTGAAAEFTELLREWGAADGS